MQRVVTAISCIKPLQLLYEKHCRLANAFQANQNDTAATSILIESILYLR